MYTIEKYMNDIVLLARSITIKHHDIGIIMNLGIIAAGGAAPSNNLAEWKYYLNLSGVKHPTNNTINVAPVEGGLAVELTPGMLDTHPATRSALDSRGSMYDNLVKEYPDDILYINGCISPVDINKAISAKDGTVLSYSMQYIEPQEFSLVRELSTRISGFFTRWYIKEYNITDSLYMSSVLSVLYSNLPNIISDIRLADVNTAEAHSFHIEHFFRSHLDIWDSVKNLDQTTQRWLYKNLITLINNVGTEETFNTVISKIFAANGIGLANYRLKQSAHTHNAIPAVGESIFSRNEPVVDVVNLTDYFITNNPVISLSDVVNKQLALTNPGPIASNYSQSTINKITRRDIGTDIVTEQHTKVVDFGLIELFKLYNNDAIGLALDVWLDLSVSKRYDRNVKIVDPNTKKILDLTPYTGIMLFYWLLSNKLGLPDTPISTIKYTNMVDGNISRTALLDQLTSGTGTSYAADLFVQHLRTIKTAYSVRINGVDNITAIINAHTSMYSDIWVLDSNVNNAFLNGNIKRMSERTLKKGVIDINNGNGPIALGTILSNNGISIDLTNTYNIDKTLVELYKTFVGSDLHEELIIAEIYKAHKVLLDKLTSYTIQTIPPVATAGSMVSPYSTIAVIQADKGYINVTDANIIKVLEINNGRVSSSGDDFIDQLMSVSDKTVRTMVDSSKGLSLYAKRMSARVNQASITYGMVMAEVVRGSYDLFYPGHRDVYGDDSNVVDFTSTATRASPTHASAKGSINLYGIKQYSSVNTAKVFSGATAVEVQYAGYDIFAPGNSSPVGNDMTIGSGSGTTVNNNPVVISGPSATTTVSVTNIDTGATKPKAYIQILP